MAYARRKKFWAPGHGNLHLSLESYTLCKDGNWHLLDTYNQKQPPFIMPLQVSRRPMQTPRYISGHPTYAQMLVSSFVCYVADKCPEVHLFAQEFGVSHDTLEKPERRKLRDWICAQNMQSDSATYESILPGSNSMRLAGTALPNVSSELSTRAASQLTSAEARKVGLHCSQSSHVCSREFGGVQNWAGGQR